VDATIRLVPVGTQSEPNVAVVAVRVLSRIVEANQPVRIEADVVNYGPSPLGGYTAGLYLGDERVAQASSDLPPGEVATLLFTLTPRDRGWLAARIETEDDGFPADNRFHFSLHVPQQRRVLLVAGDGAQTGYLETALSQALTGDRLGLELTRINERVLPSTDLAAFDVVLLAGLVDISTGESDRIARFAESGGGVLWFPAAEPVVDDYNVLLAQLGGGRVSAIEGGSPGAGAQVIDTVERFDLGHALFEGVLDAAGGRPEQPVLYRRMPYRAGSGAEATVMSLAGGGPFLQEIRTGRGIVLFVAAAADPTWTDLPTRGLFLPLLYRSIFLLSSTDAVVGEQFVVGMPGEIVLPGATESANTVIRLPSGEEVAPDRRGITGGLLLRLDGLLNDTGAYDVLENGRTIRRFTVNPDPREADLSRSNPAEVAVILSGLVGTDVDVLTLEASDPLTASSRVAAERGGVELWNVLLVVALLALIAEMAVSRHWRPEEAS
jgi:hypothetical protein